MVEALRPLVRRHVLWEMSFTSYPHHLHLLTTKDILLAIDALNRFSGGRMEMLKILLRNAQAALQCAQKRGVLVAECEKRIATNEQLIADYRATIVANFRRIWNV